MTGRCFPKSRRVRKPEAFKAVYQNNQTRVRGQYFMVLAFSRFLHADNVDKLTNSGTIPPSSTISRVGVVVSKKVSKSAVRRNRVKRLMREVFRHRQHPDGIDFVVIARPEADKANNQQLTKELNYLWKKLHKRCATVLLP